MVMTVMRSEAAGAVGVMSGGRVLVKVHPDGKYVVECDEASVPLKALKPGLRVALRADSYALHKILPSKIDPLVSLMMVEKVPNSTFDQVGGLDTQVIIDSDYYAK